MGRLLLIARGAALNAWLTAHRLGWWAGIAIGISLCAAWLRFRRTSRITRLFRANLRCYCAARRVGASIDEAIQSMVRHRYRASVEQQQALRLIAAVPTPDIEKIRVMQRKANLGMNAVLSLSLALGRLIAGIGRQPLEEVAPRYFGQLMEALRKTATRATHSNVLQHLCGYLKRVLSAAEKQELQQLIDQYRQGTVPLVVPLTLIKHHFRRHPDAYIAQQAYLQPHPAELGLRNAL